MTNEAGKEITSWADLTNPTSSLSPVPSCTGLPCLEAYTYRTILSKTGYCIPYRHKNHLTWQWQHTWQNHIQNDTEQCSKRIEPGVLALTLSLDTYTITQLDTYAFWCPYNLPKLFHTVTKKIRQMHAKSMKKVFEKVVLFIKEHIG